MTRDETLKITQNSRLINFGKAKRMTYDTIKTSAEKGEYIKVFSINLWFENVDFNDIKEFTKELKDNGFEIQLDSQLLEISWK